MDRSPSGRRKGTAKKNGRNDLEVTSLQEQQENLYYERRDDESNVYDNDVSR